MAAAPMNTPKNPAAAAPKSHSRSLIPVLRDGLSVLSAVAGAVTTGGSAVLGISDVAEAVPAAGSGIWSMTAAEISSGTGDWNSRIPADFGEATWSFSAARAVSWTCFPDFRFAEARYRFSLNDLSFPLFVIFLTAPHGRNTVC